MTKEKKETYKINVVCTNCGYGTPTRGISTIVSLTIPKCTTVDNYISTAICANCGCEGCFKKL